MRIVDRNDGTLYNIFEELKDNVERFIEVIDKQTFKDLLKTEVNNIIHTL